MSLGCQSSQTGNLGLSSNNGGQVLYCESPPERGKVAAGTTETHDTSRRLRFNNMTLDELSQELDRRTRETQRLQEEVENATKVALEKFGRTYNINGSPGQNYHNHRLNEFEQPGDFNNFPTNCQPVNQRLVCGVNSSNHEVTQRRINSPGGEVFENAVDDCLHQLTDVQLSEKHDAHEQEAFTFDKAIMNLQTKLHKVQMEKDVLSDLRLKDSRTHVDQMEKMLSMLDELQTIKRTADQRLQDTEEEALALNRKVETLEQIMKETFSSLLSQKKQCRNSAITNPSSRQRSPDARLTEVLNDETDKLKDKLLFSIDHLGSEEYRGVNKQKRRMEDLITNLCQEMALLTDKLSSSNHNSVSLSGKLELLKKLAERQMSLHQCHVSELESTLSTHKDKVCDLEQQLLQVQNQLVDAQREKQRLSQQVEEFQSELGQLKTYSEQEQCELQVEVKVLRGRLEEAREQLRSCGEENNCLQALLDQKAQERRKSQELLREKDEELQLRRQEAEQRLLWLEEARSRCQALHVEGDTLRLKLGDREKLVGVLRLQMENNVQMTVQHSHTVDNLHQENSLLSNQINQHKMESQQLRAALDQHKSDLAAAEHDRRRLQSSLAEQSRQLHEETLAKQQLATQLEIQRTQLLTLTKEHKELQRLHSCKSEEQEGVVLRLQSQLRDTHDELHQVRSNLKTLQGADGHGLQIATDMQKEITARRQQVDSLQVKIQHLEEKVEKLHEEKRYQSAENQRRLQDLTLVREEKKQLSDELEALRSKDQQLRERIGQLEAILHKMSESFADCQDFIQLREQEFYRLKLQHALDLKELQGQNLHTALKVPPPDVGSLTAPPSSPHVSNAQLKSKSPTLELSSFVKELRGTISENHRPHSDNSYRRRRSAPERVHRTTLNNDKTKEVKHGSRSRRRTCGSETHFLTTAELNGKIIGDKSFGESRVIQSPSTAVRFISSPGRRSPVHTLLTSDPNSRH